MTDIKAVMNEISVRQTTPHPFVTRVAGMDQDQRDAMVADIVAYLKEQNPEFFSRDDRLEITTNTLNSGMAKAVGGEMMDLQIAMSYYGRLVVDIRPRSIPLYDSPAQIRKRLTERGLLPLHDNRSVRPPRIGPVTRSMKRGERVTSV